MGVLSVLWGEKKQFFLAQRNTLTFDKKVGKMNLGLSLGHQNSAGMCIKRNDRQQEKYKKQW